MAALAGREEELLAQLHALLFLPVAASPSPATPAAPALKAESAAAGPLAAIVGSTTGSGRGSGPAASAAASSSVMAAAAAASSCGGAGRQQRRRRRRQGQGSKRDRDDDDSDCDAKDEKHDEAPAADARPQHYPLPRCKRRCVRGPWLQLHCNQ